MAVVVNVNDLLNDHVVLDLECLDRIYLNAYVPNLQTSGQVVSFMRTHLGMVIPSPAVMEKMGNRFRKAVDAFAEDHDIPIVHFKKGDRHIDIMTPYLEAATEPAVVAIGVAQEFQSVFAASRRDNDSGPPSFTFYKADRRISTKLGRRVLPPLLAVDHPPAPTELRQAFRIIDNHVDDYLERARLRPAA